MFYATHTVRLLSTLETDLISIIIDTMEMSRYCKRRDLQSIILDCNVQIVTYLFGLSLYLTENKLCRHYNDQ